MRPHLVVLTGAGMSAESGISTFRDQNGLWENHRIEEVATPEGFARNPDLVHQFYNLRRAQLNEVQPNPAHYALADWEKDFDMTIITQNVDDLHERAGSTTILHLHGELRKVRSVIDPDYVVDWTGPLHTSDRCPKGSPLRPHIVWFGESVPLIEKAMSIVQQADAMLVIGTSLQVYPAASLLYDLASHAPLVYLDPHPATNPGLGQSVKVIALTATQGITEAATYLRAQFNL